MKEKLLEIFSDCGIYIEDENEERIEEDFLKEFADISI